MLAALGLDGIRQRLDELGLALVGIVVALAGVSGPWFGHGDASQLGVLGDSGRFCLVALIVAFALIWRDANKLGAAGHLLGLLVAGLAVLLVAVAELIQIEATYGDGGHGAPAVLEARWGLWVAVIGAGIIVIGALVAAQLRANRGVEAG